MSRATSDVSVTVGPFLWRAGPIVAFACLALGAISALEVRHMAVNHGQAVYWPMVLLTTMPRWILLAASLPLVLRIGVETSTPRIRRRTVLVHLALFLAISWGHAAIVAWTMGLTSPIALLFPWSARLFRAWYNGTPTMVSMYGAVLLAAWGIAESRERARRTLRASQLETQLQAARLEALRAKLQPHFLYNTLNGIAALVTDVQPAKAVAAIEHLSELLHASLRDDAREEIPVAEEVALAERYLALQRMRFGERLWYEMHVAPEVAECLVPVLLLQPIVENAVVHGLDAGVERLRIAVRASAAPAGVELRVENDGTALGDTGALPAEGVPPNGSGVGLAATRARLVTMYGDRASLRLLPRAGDGGGALVRITLPRSVRPTSDSRRSGPRALAEVS